MKELGDKAGQPQEPSRRLAELDRSRATSRAAEQDLTMGSIQPLLVELIDQGVKPTVLESILFYFWFRSTALRRNLH
jgi:hypothetical protein